MVCYSPLSAWQSVKCKANGKRTIVFSQPLKADKWEHINLPCGQCVGCRLEYSRQWAVRCVHEASLYDKNCFLTLTYSDDYVPYSTVTGEQTLVKKHFQLFMKRLRSRFPDVKIRYFQCGEYGEKNSRPHYHAILFNFDFPDKQLFKINFNGSPIYISKICSELWPFGIHAIAEVNFDTCAYVARYVMKKQTGKQADAYYQGIQKEYTTMSRRSGIGQKYFQLYTSDIYPYDECIIKKNDKYIPLRPPRYYDKLFDIMDSGSMQDVKNKRLKRAKLKEFEIDTGRLADRGKVKSVQISKLKRSV